jgi:hypothetical protein
MHAISIRQPWAWAIIHGGKDVENRSEYAPRQFGLAVGKRVFVHASKTMTPDEYERAAKFMASIGVRCPAPDELQFGGVIGSVFVKEIVTRSDSPWFHRPGGARARRPASGAVRASARTGRPVSGRAMIRISITVEAFEAIARTLPLGSVGYERGERTVWLEDAMADRLGAMRGPSESYSGVILRLVGREGAGGRQCLLRYGRERDERAATSCGPSA